MMKAILQQHTVGKMVPLVKLNGKLNDFHVTALSENASKITMKASLNSDSFGGACWERGWGFGGQVGATHSHTTVAT